MKVLVGVIAGLAASFKPKENGDKVSAVNSDYAKVAGRDINETLQKINKLDGDVHEIRDSVVNQTQYIEQVAKLAEVLPPPASKTDYLFLIAGNGIDSMIQKETPQIINEWCQEGSDFTRWRTVVARLGYIFSFRNQRIYLRSGLRFFNYNHNNDASAVVGIVAPP